ncbi:Uncharacterized protein HZ326_20700 [Fusarium oxysporum f. sp. albedinis]|nr:Uncharacterized protein HZ326_20700 [Fusarium oxysporum f. sp. albedinis]
MPSQYCRAVSAITPYSSLPKAALGSSADKVTGLTQALHLVTLGDSDGAMWLTADLGVVFPIRVITSTRVSALQTAYAFWNMV